MKRLIRFFILLIVPFLSSCCKEGTGGKATFILKPQHHGAPIKGCTAYIKFDTQEGPGPDLGAYDATFSTTPTSDQIKCEEMKCGDYYVYCTGYDSSISQGVSGGIPVKIAYSERKDEITIIVPVTETH